MLNRILELFDVVGPSLTERSLSLTIPVLAFL